jgi:hypothetical protein
MTLRKTPAIAIAVAAICFAISNRLVAETADTAPIITYKAVGTFGSTPVSGEDQLKLSGEPFAVSIAVSAGTPPTKLKPGMATYQKLKLTGTVHTGLLGATPVNIGSSEASITQIVNPGKYDLFVMEAPIKVVGISLTIDATITMPSGTITEALLHPFQNVAITSSNGTVSYSDGANTTVLAIQEGTLSATIPSGGPTASVVLLHSTGAQALTLHADGTATVRPIGAAPVELGNSTDAVTLKFYATGVSGASEVHVQIGGEEVPVVYTGASGYFPGLDEVMVQAPWTLAGRGATNVTLTVDGQTAEPVHIHIQ